MISREEAQARVARGAAHLDQVRPSWFNDIDTGTLTLHDPCGCIIGQLVGHFNLCAQLGVNRLRQSERLGFEAFANADEPRASLDAAIQRVHQPLQDAWIEAIASRRHPVPEPAESPITECVLVTEGRRG